MEVKTSQNIIVGEGAIQMPTEMMSLIKSFIETNKKYGFESVEEFVISAIRKQLLELFKLERLHTEINTQQVVKSKLENKVNVTIVMPKEVYEFFKEYCEWAGFDFNEEVVDSMLWNAAANLDHVRGSPIPKADELWERVEELRKNR